MAHIDTAQLIHHATNFCCRASEVQQDPAVQKSWVGAGCDVARAFTSVAEALIETRGAWRRLGADGGAGFTALRAA